MIRANNSNEIVKFKDRGSASDKVGKEEGCFIQMKYDNVGWMEIQLTPADPSSAKITHGQDGSSSRKDLSRGPLESAKNGIKAITERGEATTVGNPWFSKYFKICGRLSAFKLSAIILVVILLIIGIGLTVWKITGDQHSTTTSTPDYQSSFTPSYTPAPLLDTDHNNDSLPEFDDPRPNGWYLISRSDWNARETEKNIVLLHHPVKNAVIAHTAGSPCYAEPQCSDKMRGIQSWAIGGLGYDDVQYNFLVGGDGNAYEGLGWNIQGFHSNKYNPVSIGIAFIGNFVYDHPTPQQFEALKRLLEWGVEIAKLDPDYRLIPHNLTRVVQSPGRFVYQEIKKWPHFTEERFYVKT